MRRELGIARCGLACCLCSEQEACPGCHADGCPGSSCCENRTCSLERGLSHCYDCPEICRKGLLAKIKPYAFTLFAQQYGEDTLLDCLERNERQGVVYHREGIWGDYDDFSSVAELFAFLRTGQRSEKGTD